MNCRLLLSALSVAVMAASSVEAQSSCVRSRGQLPSADTIQIVGVGWPSGTSGALDGAASMWNGCGLEGIPAITTGTPAGNFARVNIYYNPGVASVQGRCGLWGGNRIDIWQNTINPQTQQVVRCDQFGWAQVIAHEIGHDLGLNHPASTCTTDIMADVNGFAHSVKPYECARADEINRTQAETGGKNGQCLPGDEACQGTPIVLNFENGLYRLTGLDDPVSFDLDANGFPEATGWTAGGADHAFLVLDRNSNGLVDDGRELFGNKTPMSGGGTGWNGFVALSDLDENLDMWIDSSDPSWQAVRLWFDVNHDGHSDPSEIASLDDRGVVAIGLNYFRSERVDPHGNTFRFVSVVLVRNERGQVLARPVYDIYFVSEGE